MTAFAADALSGGFAAPVFDAQATFRAVMAAMAEPARPVPLAARATGPAPMTPTLAAVVLTLVDADTPVWIDGPLALAPDVVRWLAFHTGAPVVADPADAAFALVVAPARLPAFETFARGTAEYPDRSTTLLLAVDGFADDGPLFDGPGFEAPRRFAPTPAPAAFARQMAANRGLFPRGVDLVFCAPAAVAALPRSTRIRSEG